MESSVFYKGFLAGLIICAPFGPIGFLAVRRMLTEGRLTAFLSLMGASTGDAVYCALAGLGVQAIPVFIINEKAALHFLVGSILALVGVSIFMSHPKLSAVKTQAEGMLKIFTSIFLLVMVNPLPILIFTGVFTLFGVSGWKGDALSTSWLVAGVFFGSAAWSAIFAAGAPLIRSEIKDAHLRNLNRVTGALITAFGLALAVRGVL